VEFDSVTADANDRLMLTDTWNSLTDGVGIAGLQLEAGSPVPEPASAVLFALGSLILLGVARWRRTD
jgi:hypothetical protein